MRNCLHQEWNIDKQKIIDQSFIRKTILDPLDKINMNDKHSTNMLYCKGCIDYVTATCTECGTFVVKMRVYKQIHVYV